jgi:hypothetical protein
VSDGGRRWTFTLRPGARFWDGTPVTAAGIIETWSARTARSGATLWPANSATALSDGRLLVEVAESGIPVARELADLALAIYRPPGQSPTPLGTGPFRLADQARGPLTLEPTGTHAGAAPETMEFYPIEGDPRDLLDAGIDLLVTEDRVTLEYGRAKPEYDVVPLPWDRRYALTLPVAPDSAGSPAPPGFQESLARHAVPGEARPAPPFSGRACGADGPPAPAERRNADIMFRADDRTAQALAERLVVVARSPGGAWLAALLGVRSFRGIPAAIGLADDDYWRALAAGDHGAYVVSRPVAPPSCAMLTGVREKDIEHVTVTEIPLVETRRHAVVRRGVTGFVVDADGTPWWRGTP